jgi:hypothetical protein
MLLSSTSLALRALFAFEEAGFHKIQGRETLNRSQQFQHNQLYQRTESEFLHFGVGI